MSQIYIFETFASKLTLKSDVVKDAETKNFIIKINFLNFPIMEINSTHKSSTDIISEYEEFIFNSGQLHHFNAKPKDLMKSIIKNPLKIGIFRLGDSFPLCEAIIPFSGCACELSLYSGIGKSPKPLELEGPFYLMDPGKNSAGHVQLQVAIKPYGRSIHTYYTLQHDILTFKKIGSTEDYQCTLINVPAVCSNTENNSVPDSNSIYCKRGIEFNAADDSDSAKTTKEKFVNAITGISLTADRLTFDKKTHPNPANL
ncbi:uncharacterized protein LOC112494241 [Cephus cinctus]|uniref:Uncharacterized protein LOC112494241 n=1 Tax=Cephus cinctus TaxID=211228 RepID=A0AAJ7RFL5_CEPCN|nr:uncharacterized protein LOC112494241 [Cephus cinctus]